MAANHCRLPWFVLRMCNVSNVRSIGSQTNTAVVTEEAEKKIELPSRKETVKYPKHFRNRNPRNLELLGIAPKPKGFHTLNARIDFYNKLQFTVSKRHVTGYVEHNTGVRVIEASTKEFVITRHLYKTTDVSAAYNIGRVLAQRCREAGLTRIMWDHKRCRPSEKLNAFLNAVRKNGILLNEPKVRKQLPSKGKSPPLQRRPSTALEHQY